jgi:hypothetical protein
VRGRLVLRRPVDREAADVSEPSDEQLSALVAGRIVWDALAAAHGYQRRCWVGGFWVGTAIGSIAGTLIAAGVAWIW